MTEYIKKDIEAVRKGFMYEMGIGLVEQTEKKKQKQSKENKCPHCGKMGHVRRSSRHCDKHDEYCLMKNQCEMKLRKKNHPQRMHQ